MKRIDVLLGTLNSHRLCFSEQLLEPSCKLILTHKSLNLLLLRKHSESTPVPLCVYSEESAETDVRFSLILSLFGPPGFCSFVGLFGLYPTGALAHLFLLPERGFGL